MDDYDYDYDLELVVGVGFRRYSFIRLLRNITLFDIYIYINFFYFTPLRGCSTYMYPSEGR